MYKIYKPCPCSDKLERINSIRAAPNLRLWGWGIIISKLICMILDHQYSMYIHIWYWGDETNNGIWADETCCMSNGQTQPILTYSVNFSCCFEQKHEQLNPITKTSGAQECRQRKKLKTWYGGDDSFCVVFQCFFALIIIILCYSLFFTSNPVHNSIILRRSFRRPCLCVSFKLVKDNLLVIMIFPHMYVVGKKRAAERPCRQRHCMYSTVLYSTYVNSYIW